MSDNKLTMTTKDVSFKKKANSFKTTISIADANGKNLLLAKITIKMSAILMNMIHK